MERKSRGGKGAGDLLLGSRWRVLVWSAGGFGTVKDPRAGYRVVQINHLEHASGIAGAVRSLLVDVI